MADALRRWHRRGQVLRVDRGTAETIGVLPEAADILTAATVDAGRAAIAGSARSAAFSVVGVLPALIAWRAAAAPTLRDGGAAVSGLARSRARGALVVAQVAVAVVLHVGAGLLSSPDLANRDVAWRTASRGYFAAIGTSLRRGEPIPERWTRDAPRVAVVNERFVRLYLGGRHPIGREIAEPGRDTPRYRIVGVVGDGGRPSTRPRRCRPSTCRQARPSGRSCTSPSVSTAIRIVAARRPGDRQRAGPGRGRGGRRSRWHAQRVDVARASRRCAR